jgi:RecT family
MKKVSIMDMPEDLLDEDQPKQRSKSPKAKSKCPKNQGNQPESGSALDALVRETANTLGIAMEELHNWTQEVIVPKDVLQSILTTAKRYQLNPLLGQIDWELNEENHWEIYIPIDGWITMIHREPTFKGIAFDQSPETEDGIPIWMECTIYRSDLTHPVTVREYYAELKTEHPIWQQMPRRMLRHKTLQQCARLAFGIVGYVQMVQRQINKNLIIKQAPLDRSPKDPKSVLKVRLQKMSG